MGISRIVVAAMGVVVVVSLASACAPQAPDPAADETVASTPSASPTQAPAPDPEPAFVVPVDCATLIGPVLTADFAAEGIVLFDSTAGEGIYAGGGSVPFQTGGSTLFCVYGKDMVDLSSFQLEAQPLTQAEHEGVVASLDAAGLAKTVDGDIVTYTQVGDDMGTPSLIHVLHPDGWLTGWSAFGGPGQVTLLTRYLDEVAAQVYPG